MRWCDGCGGVAGQKKIVKDKQGSEPFDRMVFYCSDSCLDDIVKRLSKVGGYANADTQVPAVQ